MMKNNKPVSLSIKKNDDRVVTNLLVLIQELELAIALSPVLSSSQARQLEAAIIKLVKQI